MRPYMRRTRPRARQRASRQAAVEPNDIASAHLTLAPSHHLARSVVFRRHERRVQRQWLQRNFMRSFRDERPRYIRWVRDDAYNAATARRDRAPRARDATRASRELWDTDERLNELLPTLTRHALEKTTDDEARRARET